METLVYLCCCRAICCPLERSLSTCTYCISYMSAPTSLRSSLSFFSTRMCIVRFAFNVYYKIAVFILYLCYVELRTITRTICILVNQSRVLSTCLWLNGSVAHLKFKWVSHNHRLLYLMAMRAGWRHTRARYDHLTGRVSSLCLWDCCPT